MVTLIRDCDTPLIVFEPLIQRVIPCSRVAMPRVTMSDSIPTTMMKKLLITPTTTPTRAAKATAQPTGQASCTFSCAMIMVDRPTIAPTETS